MRALIVATSCNRLPSGHPTGLWAEEFAVPYMTLTDAGVDVVVASPSGGAVPVDEKSKPSQSDAKEWAPALVALQSTVALQSVANEEFDLIFLPGGHGPLVDLAGDATLRDMLARQDAAGRLMRNIGRGGAAIWPVMRAMACFTRSRSAVNGIAGVPRPKATTANRSDADNRSMN